MEMDSHPLMPKFYGVTEDNHYIIIQYFDGQKLSDLLKDRRGNQLLKLDFEEKIIILFQIIAIIETLYYQGFIYRDLKPNNILINRNKVAFIVDFDRMIRKENFYNETHKNDYGTDFMDPELLNGEIYDTSDIYSIGQMIFFVLNEEMPSKESIITENFRNYPILFNLYKRCIDEPNKRPNIKTLLREFGENYLTLMFHYLMKNAKIIQNIFTILKHQIVLKAITRLAKYFKEGRKTNNINKDSIYFYSVAAKRNDKEAQYQLGLMYYEGKNGKRDINKAIENFTLAANQNHLEAIFFLGQIYYEGKYIEQDIKKSIEYFTQAANQNHVNAQYNLGVIYHEDKSVRDLDKSIHYLTLAAKQNDAEAQYILGCIYYQEASKRNINKSIDYLTLSADNNFVDAQYYLGYILYENKIDINKSIHYFTLASKQNHSEAQFNLGTIYYEAINVPRDINKAIYYFTLSANQNNSKALYNLGNIYFKNKYISRNIKKAIKYYEDAAKNNDPEANFALGLIYLNDKYVKKDINKSIYYIQMAAKRNHPGALTYLGLFHYYGNYLSKNLDLTIHYFSLAEKQNDPYAQYNLGLFYLNDDTMKNKGVELLINSSLNNFHKASFVVGFIYHEGKYVEQDIIKSIHFYKDASTFNVSYAKNNLGIIYKNGFGDIIPQNIENAMIYFNEAIKLKNDPIAMYNLAHIYLYNNLIEKNIDESIELLINSSIREFNPSIKLLCIALLIKHNYDVLKIKQNLIEKVPPPSDLPIKICEMINKKQLNNKNVLEQFYHKQKSNDYLYNYFKNHTKSKKIMVQTLSNTINSFQNITTEFYEGFGGDL